MMRSLFSHCVLISLMLNFPSIRAFVHRAEWATMKRLFATSRRYSAATASLPPLMDEGGTVIEPDTISNRLSNKRVAFYFAAGWCPMCTSFEPSLLKFREEAVKSDKPVEIIYVPSDRSASDQVKRAAAMGMLSVPFGKDADDLKTKHKVWSGSEAVKLGFGRRSGVPALVVLDGENGEELAFIAAESQGVRSLSSWPLDDERGIWMASR